jgi:phosphoenolpyruvate carboxylase
MDLVAAQARLAYDDLVQSPGFLSFFREATPIDVIETSGIGSRPSRRTGQATLSDLRAIPWVFAWAQARFALTGWYGFGSALSTLERSEPALYSALTKHALEWPIARYIVSNVSVSVLSADIVEARAYAALVRDDSTREHVMGKIEGELDRTRATLEALYGAPLHKARSRVARLLALRHEALGPVHAYQRTLLARFRSGGQDDDALRRVLLGTVNAIAAGLRTTG